MPLLEIAVFSAEGARIAQDAGADRLEICTDYNNGGVTPDIETLENIGAFLTIPATVMIRPRPGNFIYSLSEIFGMMVSIEQCKILGFSGVVFGTLTEDNTLDLPALNELLGAANGLETTFHRAFDLCTDAEETILLLKNAGVKRILSAAWKEKGLDHAKKLNALAGDEIVYMPGGGIRKENVLQLAQSGFREIHSAAITDLASQLPDAKEIQAMKSIMNV